MLQGYCRGVGGPELERQHDFMLLALGKASISVPSSVPIQTSKSGLRKGCIPKPCGEELSLSWEIYT